MEQRIWINVFKNERRQNDKAPTHNVVIDFPDGTRLEGGLWDKVSKNGLQYKSGSLSRPKEKDEPRQPEPKAVSVDW